MSGWMQSLRALARLKPTQKLTRDYLVSLLTAVLLALAVGAAIMLVCGHNPIEGYGALIEGALGKPRAIGNTLAKTVTLCLTGLAMSLAAKAGVFNVGGEGQLYLGAMAAAVVGAQLDAPAWLVTLLALLAAMAAGGLYALLPGALKVKWKVDEVITTIMLNSVAIYFCSYLANGPLKTAERGIATGTDSIMAEAAFTPLIKLSNLTTGVFYAAVAALIVWYVMSRSSVGFEMKLTGENDRFARYGGIRTGSLMLWAMVFSGAICGLVGMLEVFGLHKRFLTTVSNEFYFDGMLVAMIMRYSPFGVILMSFFFAVLSIGSKSMELSAGVSSELILIVQSIIIFFMAAEGGIRSMLEDAAMEVMMINGGSVVPLWNTWLDGLAEGAPEGAELDAAGLKAMLGHALESLSALSKAKVGDKTMMDALIPATAAALACEGGEEEIFRAAAQAALEGAEASRNFVSKFGRARSYGEATIGTPDAGAVSMSRFFAGLAE